jgi:hypothetical protein
VKENSIFLQIFNLEDTLEFMKRGREKQSKRGRGRGREEQENVLFCFELHHKRL